MRYASSRSAAANRALMSPREIWTRGLDDSHRVARCRTTSYCGAFVRCGMAAARASLVPVPGGRRGSSHVVYNTLNPCKNIVPVGHLAQSGSDGTAVAFCNELLLRCTSLFHSLEPL